MYVTYIYGRVLLLSSSSSSCPYGRDAGDDDDGFQFAMAFDGIPSLGISEQAHTTCICIAANCYFGGNQNKLTESSVKEPFVSSSISVYV